MFPDARSNELKPEFRESRFASTSSSLAWSAFICARMSSRVAVCANTVEAFYTLAAEITDVIINAAKILENILL